MQVDEVIFSQPSPREMSYHAYHELSAATKRKREPLLQSRVETIAHGVALVPRASVIDVDHADDALRRPIDIDLSVKEVSEHTRLEVAPLKGSHGLLLHHVERERVVPYATRVGAAVL